MQLDILNIKGEKTGRTIELPEEIFGIEPNDHTRRILQLVELQQNREGLLEKTELHHKRMKYTFEKKSR